MAKKVLNNVILSIKGRKYHLTPIKESCQETIPEDANMNNKNDNDTE